MSRIALTALALLLAVPGSARSGGIDEALEDALIEAARSRVDLPRGGSLGVRDVRPADRALVRDARRVGRVELPPGERGTGTMTARVWFVTASGATEWTWVSARVEARVPTVVASRDLPRGHVLTAGDMKVALRADRSDGLEGPEQAIGQVTRRAVKADRPLSGRWLRSPRVIDRGDTVDVVVRRGGVVIRAVGRALRAGGVGDRIRVEVDGTDRILVGVIRSAGEVEVSS